MLRIRPYACFLAFSIVITTFASEAKETEPTLKRAAIKLATESMLVPGMAAYCNKYVNRNDDLISAAASWNKTHLNILKRVVDVLKSEGGLSKKEKKTLDIAAFRAVKKIVEGSKDKVKFCASLARIVLSGRLDFNQRSKLKLLLEIVSRRQ